MWSGDDREDNSNDRDKDDYIGRDGLRAHRGTGPGPVAQWPTNQSFLPYPQQLSPQPDPGPTSGSINIPEPDPQLAGLEARLRVLAEGPAKEGTKPENAEKPPERTENATAPGAARPGWLEPWTPPANYNGPVNNGRWVNPDGSPGQPNNSLWISTRQEVIDVVGINPATGEANPIVFYRGVADFSPWAVGQPLEVPGLVGTSVNSNADMRLIMHNR